MAKFTSPLKSCQSLPESMLGKVKSLHEHHSESKSLASESCKSAGLITEGIFEGRSEQKTFMAFKDHTMHNVLQLNFLIIIVNINQFLCNGPCFKHFT